MAYLYRTADFSSSNATSAVLSFWIKKTKNDTLQGLFLGYNNASNYATCYINNDDTIYYKEKNGGTQYETRITSGTRNFRDLNAWYHFVFQWDYTQATASNRIKVWINGELQTWENTGNLPPQNYSLRLKSSDFRIGNYTHAGSNYYTWQGLMSHVHFIDDASYDTYSASTFGSTDATTGEWKINTSPTISNYGSQGFFILKDDNLGTDRSGKGNNLTTSGTLTKTEDNPSNVFATMNPLWRPMNDQTYSFEKGNTRVYANSNTDWLRSNATIGAKTGKWWYEVHLGTANNENRIGWDSIDHSNETNQNYYSGLNVSNGSSNGDVRGGIRGTSSYSPNAIQLPADGGGNATWTQGDYLGMGIDLDNQTITIHKNGSALATNWSYAGYSGTSVLKSRGFFIAPSANWYSGSGNQNIYDFNFGNGSFNGTSLTGTTYTDSNSQGVFKYQPPTNYLAWCTKNLNV